MLDRYLAQVRLLLTVLPEIARETAFALRGGTAINLFYRDLPRLSVDLDLTWLPARTAALRSATSTRPSTASQRPCRTATQRSKLAGSLEVAARTHASWSEPLGRR